MRHNFHPSPLPPWLDVLLLLLHSSFSLQQTQHRPLLGWAFHSQTYCLRASPAICMASSSHPCVLTQRCLLKKTFSLFLKRSHLLHPAMVPCFALFFNVSTGCALCIYIVCLLSVQVKYKLTKDSSVCLFVLVLFYSVLYLQGLEQAFGP